MSRQKNEQDDDDDKIRIDKWLWAARFYKTRSLSKQAIDGGKIHCDGQRIKPSKEVTVGLVLTIRQDLDEKTVVVKALSAQRRGAPEAALLYEETEESKTLREKRSAERKAGLYLWDVLISGTNTALDALIPNKFLDPLEPALILPEVKDSKYWRGGAPVFLDPGHQSFIMTLMHRGTLYINSNLVNPKEFTSHKDLLDPKWKGKIVADDPRKSGTGQATFLFFYRHPQLGGDFIRSLSRQDVSFAKNYAQEVDMLGQGRFPVGIGLSDSIIEERTKRGVPVAILDPRLLKEGAPITPASGALSLVNRAPHPNAAKLYINWLLSKEAQTALAQTTGYISNRVDVPTDHASPWKIPQPDSIKIYDADAKEMTQKLMPLLHELFGR